MEIECRRAAPGVRAAGAALSAAALFATPAVAGDTILQPAEIVIAEGDLVPNIGDVVTVRTGLINSSGFWAVDVRTDHINPNSDRVIVKPGGIVVREGSALAEPPGAVIDEFVQFALADDGSMAFQHRFPNNGWGLYLGDELIALDGEAVAVTGIPTSIYTLAAPLHLNSAGQLLARVLSLSGQPLAEYEALVVYESTGPGVVGGTVVVLTGQTLPGQTEPLQDVSGGRWGASLDAEGRVLFMADTGNGSDTRVVYLSDDGVFTDFTPPDHDLGFFGRVGLSDDGGQVIRTSSTMQVNGEVVSQVAAPIVVPGMGSGSFTNVDFPFIAEGGRTVWMGSWVTSQGLGEGLFVDGELLVQRDTTVIDGHLVTSLRDTAANGSPPYNLDVSSDGQWLLFGARLEGVGEAVVRVFLGPWTGLGEGLAGGGLPEPLLTGVGPLTAGSDNALELRHAAPSSALLLVTGLSETPQPFFGGTLVPSPDFLRFGTTDAEGAFSFPFFLPGAAVGPSFVSQVWVRDPAAPAGLAASNAVRGVTQP